MRFVIVTILSLLSLSAFADRKIEIVPKRPVACKNAENTEHRVARITKAFVSKMDNLIKISLVWTTGTCQEVHSGNGHVPKHFYKVTLTGNRQYDLRDYSVSSSHSTNKRFLMTEIYFDEAELEANDYLNLKLRAGLFYSQLKIKIIQATDNTLSLQVIN